MASLATLPRQIKAVIYALCGAFIVMTGLLFLIGFDIMALRLWLLGWLLFSLVLLVGFRLLASVAITDAESRGDLARRAVIVGGGKPAEDLIRRLSRSGNRAIRILGVFDDRGGERSPEAVDVYRKIGTFDELEAYCREQAVDLLIIALPATAEERILHLVKKLWQLPIDVRIAAHASRLKLSKRARHALGRHLPYARRAARPRA
jgi:FlaA1/EpsC-like NDP-sugar epimerase